MICNKDCEHCRFDDCINDEMDAQDYEQAERRDELCMSKTKKLQREQNRQKYHRHKERYKAYSREYYLKHKEESKTYHLKYNAVHRLKIAAQKKEYAKRNRGLYGQKQRALRVERMALGLTQKQVAKHLGVSPSTVSQWERGLLPCNMESMLRRMRECAKDLMG